MGVFGFLKLKKAGKKGDAGKLSIPDLPPMKESSVTQLPIFPGSDRFNENPELPPLESFEPIEFEGDIKEEPAPEVKEPEIEPAIREPEETEQEIEPAEQEVNPPFETAPQEEQEELEKEVAEEEPKSLGFEKENPKEQIFVKAYEFRTLLESISRTTSLCRETRKGFTIVQEIEKEKNEAFVRWHSALEDIQRRLVFID